MKDAKANGQPGVPTPPSSPPNPGEAPGTIAFRVLAPATERLDRFLAGQLSLSRTQAARLIGEGAVTVNGAVGRAGRSLARGDLVEVRPRPEEPPRPITPHHIPLDVRFEDEYLLVLDKPAGLVVHPAPGHWEGTLVNALAARGMARPAGASDRPGIVHRLDRDTSGLMIVAKTDQAHRRLARAIADRRVERRYAALVWGHVAAARDIDAPLARHPRDRKRMAVVPGGREARSRVEPVARFAVCDLVRVRLETGRTHQIRVHLAHVGHPVVGDPVYGAGGSRRVTGAQRPLAQPLERAATRQALHAAHLAFAHPETREWRVFQSDWPVDLRPALALAAGEPGLLARPSVLDYLGFFK
jgi:23S rRNA pseudouridine1911/1915/1917 synthase